MVDKLNKNELEAVGTETVVNNTSADCSPFTKAVEEKINRERVNSLVGLTFEKVATNLESDDVNVLCKAISEAQIQSKGTKKRHEDQISTAVSNKNIEDVQEDEVDIAVPFEQVENDKKDKYL